MVEISPVYARAFDRQARIGCRSGATSSNGGACDDNDDDDDDIDIDTKAQLAKTRQGRQDMEKGGRGRGRGRMERKGEEGEERKKGREGVLERERLLSL